MVTITTSQIVSSMTGNNYSEATKRFFLAAKNAELTGLQQLASNCKIVGVVSDMIHQLQKERGTSNVFLASRCTQFGQKRLTQIEHSKLSESMLRSQLKALYLNGHELLGNMRLLSSITLALQGIDHLPELRKQVDNLDVTPLVSTQAYCRLISSLLSVVFDAADVSGDPDITRLLVALFNFIQAKEYAGQERAWGAIGFAETHFNKSLCERLSQLQTAQLQSIDIFTSFAHSDDLAKWQTLANSDQVNELVQMRKMICQLADGTPIAAQISEVWYDLATKRIDMMHEIEESLIERMLFVANAKVEQAESTLRDHTKRLKALAGASQANTGGLSLLFDPKMPGLRGADTMTKSEIDADAGLTVNRSIYALLREQSENIKKMSHELEEAKQAVTDQKLIDRAKLILMQQLDMTEEQAYRKLQKSAMDQHCKLIEVAEGVLAVTQR